MRFRKRKPATRNRSLKEKSSLRDHSVIVLVSYTVLVAASTWAAFNFMFDVNKIDNYKSKIEVLEKHNTILSDENKKYLTWLEKSKDTIPYFENTLSELSMEIVNLKKSASPSEQPSLGKSIGTDLEVFKNDSFVSSDGTLVFGLSDVDVYGNATVSVTFRGIEKFSRKTVVSGTVLPMSEGKYKASIIVKKVNYVGGYVVIVIQ